MSRTKTMPDYQDEADRFAEGLHQRFGKKIFERETFIEHYHKYINATTLSSKEKKFMNIVEKEYAKTHTNYAIAESLGEKGKNPQAKKAFVTYEKSLQKNKERVMDIPAKKKGKVVFAEQTSVKIFSKNVIKYRDSKGQFVSIRK